MAAPRFGRLQRIAAAFGLVGTREDAPDSEAWSIDDMAERREGGHWIGLDGEIAHEPCGGHVDIVREVCLARGRDGRHRIYLVFARWPNCLFDARGFRKLTPRADAAASADAAFVDQLKRGRIPAPSLLDRLAARLANTHQRIPS